MFGPSRRTSFDRRVDLGGAGTATEPLVGGADSRPGPYSLCTIWIRLPQPGRAHRTCGRHTISGRHSMARRQTAVRETPSASLLGAS